MPGTIALTKIYTCGDFEVSWISRATYERVMRGANKSTINNSGNTQKYIPRVCRNCRRLASLGGPKGFNSSALQDAGEDDDIYSLSILLECVCPDLETLSFEDQRVVVIRIKTSASIEGIALKSWENGKSRPQEIEPNILEWVTEKAFDQLRQCQRRPDWNSDDEEPEVSSAESVVLNHLQNAKPVTFYKQR